MAGVVFKQDDSKEGLQNPPELTQDQIDALESKKAEGDDKPTIDKDDNNDTGDVSIDDVIYKLDKDGNALDEAGKVFKTKDEIKTLEDTKGDDKGDVDVTEVLIDDVTFKLDDKGNAVDDKGVIKYTKEQLDEFESADSDENKLGINIKDIADQTKLNLYDDKGNLLEYQNTPEGITSYVNDVYEKGKKDAQESTINSLNTAYPWLDDLLTHVKLGGKLEDFSQSEDFNSIKLDKTNEDQLKSIIFRGRSTRGEDRESTDRYYNYLKSSDTDNDVLLKEAQKELKFLSDRDALIKTNKQQTLVQQEQIREQELNNYWGVTQSENGEVQDLGVKDSVYSIIKNKQLQLGNETFSIPDTIRVIEDGKPKVYSSNDFFNYLYAPIVVEQNGQRITTTRDNLKLSQEQQTRTVHNDIYDALLRFANYDKSQFVKEQVNKDKVKQIKKLSSKKVVAGGSIDGGKKARKVVFK